ncbi:hypothetical protein RDV64_18070 [Acuticoccus sp. MNP-M23]|uniref:hypothetical protein n=1 Tax=Acuticoccus sp. MNP-M23 TaxID=3072793 RepID=UPI002816150C|nr:hypothetical protein [Acuticoccus sp. MNP-M23]WMS41955.1 hypothetical protein RDV64_18070 [Acuticoccus sp. MNP-M23]
MRSVLLLSLLVLLSLPAAAQTRTDLALTPDRAALYRIEVNAAHWPVTFAVGMADGTGFKNVDQQLLGEGDAPEFALAAGVEYRFAALGDGEIALSAVFLGGTLAEPGAEVALAPGAPVLLMAPDWVKGQFTLSATEPHGVFQMIAAPGGTADLRLTLPGGVALPKAVPVAGPYRIEPGTAAYGARARGSASGLMAVRLVADGFAPQDAMEGEAGTLAEAADGLLTAGDVDDWRMTVPQGAGALTLRLRAGRTLPVPGLTLHEVDDTGAPGARIAGAEGRRGRVELEDLVLPPGSYVVRVTAAKGISAQPYRLERRRGRTPPQGREVEPNDVAALATKLPTGQLIAGDLAAGDVDVFALDIPRADERWRIAATGDIAQLTLAEASGTALASARGGTRGTRIDEVALLPGRHLVTVAGAGAYGLKVLPLGPAPEGWEHEPNGTPALAQRLRHDEEVRGVVRRAEFADWFSLNVPRARTVALNVEPPGRGGLTLTLMRGSTKVETHKIAPDAPWKLVRRLEPGAWSIGLEARGNNDEDVYALHVGAPPGDVAMALNIGPQTVAAHHRAGQRLNGELTINAPDGGIDAALLASPPAPDWRFEGLPDKVALAAGETATFPLTLIAPPMVSGWDDLVPEIRLERDETAAIVQTVLRADPEAPPVGSHLFFAVPDAMRGGIDVARYAHGGRIVRAAGQAFEGPVVWRSAKNPGLGTARTWRRDLVNDGFTGHYRVEKGYGTPTIRFEVTSPLVGVAMSARSWGETAFAQGVRRFAIETSNDGTAWQLVREARVETLEGLQYFPFDGDVSAGWLRLRDLDCPDPDNCATRLAEVMAIARPGFVPPALKDADLGDPALGGHVVSGFAVTGTRPVNLVTAGAQASFKADALAKAGSDRAVWVLGLAGDRASEIARIAWEGETGRLTAGRVDLRASAGDAAGPWVELGALEPGGTLTLDTPVWARFIEVSTPPVDGEVLAPDRLRITPTARGLAVLGLWDEGRTAGPYEAAGLAPAPGEIASVGGTTRGDAVPLTGEVESAVRKGVREDWFAVTVPEEPGQAFLRVRLSHPRMLEVGVRLVDQAGTEVDLAPIETFRDKLPELFPPLADGAPPPDEVWPANWPRHTGREYDLAAEIPAGPHALRVFEGPRTLTMFRELSSFMAPNLPAIRAGTRAVADMMADDDGLSFPRLSLTLADDSGLLRGREAVLRSLSGGAVSRGNETPSFGAALARETARIAFEEGGKAMLFLGSGNGIDRDWLGTPDTARAPVDAGITQCTDEARCAEQSIAEMRVRDIAAATGGGMSWIDGPRDVALLFDKTLAAMTGPKRYRLWTEVLRGPEPEPEPEQEPEQAPEAEPKAPSEPEPEPVAALPAELPPLAPSAPGRLRIELAGAGGDALDEDFESDFGPAAPVGPAVGVILDASGSMLQRLDGRRRIEVAREALTGLALHGLPSGSPFALTAFGFRPEACELRTVAAFGPLDPGRVVAGVADIEAINRARTPIAASLQDMAERLTAHEGPQTIVLVTDGEETCDGNVPDTIRTLRAQGYDLRVNIVGFAIDDPVLKATFTHWSKLGGGEYLDAVDAAGLAASLTRSAAPPPPPPPPLVEIRSAAAEILARMLPGEMRTLPAGDLRIGPDAAPATLEPGTMLVAEVDETGAVTGLRIEPLEDAR